MTGFALKLIAIASMLIDHSGVTFRGLLDYRVYEAMRSLGRIAFPIFVFLLAEGCRRTSNMKKYLLRLGLFALVSEIPFDFLFANTESPGPKTIFLEFGYQNVFFTLFLGALAVWYYQRVMKERPEAFGSVLNLTALGLIIAAASLLRTDYDSVGAAAVFFCYAAKDKRWQAPLLFVIFSVFYLSEAKSLLDLWAIGGVAVSAVCLLFYNGRRGRPLKWAFYVFYPLHLTALGLVYHFIIK